jgi:hypothetical protein
MLCANTVCDIPAGIANPRTESMAMIAVVLAIFAVILSRITQHMILYMGFSRYLS